MSGSNKRKKTGGKQEKGLVSGAESSTPAPIQNTEVTPMVMMQMAIKEGSDVATMERLWALNEKVEAANARKAFFLALSKFKENPPQVVKDKLNAQYGSTYVGIGNMVSTVSEEMGKFGLTHSWTFGDGENKQMTCTCVMTHSLGHQESVTMSSPVDESGKKNPLQGRKSTRTYLKLETFEAVTGMVSVDGNIDDDGNSYGATPTKFISESQANDLDSKIRENEVDMKAFLNWMKKELKIKSIEAIPENHYDYVDKKIDAAIKSKSK